MILSDEQLNGIIETSGYEDFEIYLPDGYPHAAFKYTVSGPCPPIDNSSDWIDTHLLQHERELFDPCSFVYSGKTWHEYVKSHMRDPNVSIKDLALCNWTKTSWQDHIRLVHEGNTHFQLTSP